MALVQIKSGSSHHRAAAVAMLAVLMGFAWMVTYGTFRLADSDTFGQFYDAQAQSLLAGRWDVPEKDVFPEGFHRNGKSYGYYGFVPALPRMALNRCFPAMWGAWSRISVTLACGVTLLYSYLLLLRLRIPQCRTDATPGPMTAAGLIVLAGLGSTTIYLGSCAFIYHEAIIWAVALALACYYHLLRYLNEGRWTQLSMACGLAFLSFFCRISSGCGPCLAILLAGLNVLAWHAPRRLGALPGLRWLRRLNGWSSPPPLAHAAMAGVALLAIFATYVAINHAKFGTILDAAPIQFYSLVADDPIRWARTGGKWMRLGNVPLTLYAYFSPHAIDFEPTFPWVYLQMNLQKFPGNRMAGNGPYSSAVTAMPLLLALTLVGLVALAQGHRARPRGAIPAAEGAETSGASPALLLIGSLGGIAPVLPFFTVDNRYLHEFFPFLILGAALGLHRVAGIRSRRLRSALAAAMVVIGLYQIFVNCAFGLSYQRLMVWSRPNAPQVEMLHWRRTIDKDVAHLLHQ